MPMVGAPGTAAGVTTTPAEARPSPTELTALTLQTYTDPLARPVTTIGLDAPVTVTVVFFVVPVTHDAL